MQTYTFYTDLIKPSWAPPASVFGPVWTCLYVIIAVSFGYVVYLAVKKRISFATLLPFLLNLAFNLAFTPLQFGLKSNLLAAIDILLVLGTLLWAMRAIYRHSKEACWVVYANLPYLAWVAFATALQLTITYLNW